MSIDTLAVDSIVRVVAGRHVGKLGRIIKFNNHCVIVLIDNAEAYSNCKENAHTEIYIHESYLQLVK